MNRPKLLELTPEQVETLATALHAIHKPGAPMHRCVPCYRDAAALAPTVAAMVTQAALADATEETK